MGQGQSTSLPPVVTPVALQHEGVSTASPDLPLVNEDEDPGPEPGPAKQTSPDQANGAPTKPAFIDGDRLLQSESVTDAGDRDDTAVTNQMTTSPPAPAHTVNTVTATQDYATLTAAPHSSSPSSSTVGLPSTLGGTTSHPSTLGDTTSHPSTLGDTTSHPSTLGDTTSHPSTLGDTTSHPSTLGDTTSHPSTLGDTTSHPSTLGNTTSHPSTLGDTTSHPSTLGDTTYPGPAGGHRTTSTPSVLTPIQSFVQPSTPALTPAQTHTLTTENPKTSAPVHVPAGPPHQVVPPELTVGDEDKGPHLHSPLDPLLASLVSIFIITTAIVSVVLFLKFRQRTDHPEFYRLQDLPMDDLMEDTPLSRYTY